jgi:DNA-binding MurR/RpiR family transcriptional regulator
VTETVDERQRTVADATEQAMNRLSAAERRVARALLADYPSAGLSTVAELAGRAQVSPPTVVRFAQRIGLSGFAALQTSMREELTHRSGSGPLSRPSWRAPSDPTAASILRRAREQTDQALECLAHLSPYALDAAVALLANPARRLILTGGRFSRLLATHLALHLEQLRPGVAIMNDPTGRDLGTMLDLHRRDVLVLFDLARYTRAAVDLARSARRARATVLLITDNAVCPAAADADVVLAIASNADQAFQSMTGAFLLTELLVPPVMERLGEPALTRLGLWERHRAKELLP